MPPQKINNKIISTTVEAMQLIDKTFNELIAEFGSLDLLKPADAYLLGVVRTSQASCSYLSSFASDLDKQANRRIEKKQVDPNLKNDPE